MKITPVLFSQSNFESVLNASQDAAILMDSNEKIVFCNQATETVLGYSAIDLVGQALPPILDKSMFQSLQKLSVSESLNAQDGHALNVNRSPNRLETSVYKQDGESVWVEVTLSILPAGDHHFLYLQLRPKNKDKLSEVGLQSLSSQDDLTGLNNRREFQRLLENHINHPLSLAIVDIDQYKKINHQFGFLVGNDALQTFANLLKSEFPDAICVSRLRGDEFGIIYSGGVGSGFYKKCEALREKVTQLDFIDFDMPITVSIGVAKYVENSRQLLSKADEALLIAKRNGRNRVHMLLK